MKKTQDAKYGWKYGCGAQGCTKVRTKVHLMLESEMLGVKSEE
jgi:hypothetical protein